MSRPRRSCRALPSAPEPRPARGLRRGVVAALLALALAGQEHAAAPPGAAADGVEATWTQLTRYPNSLPNQQLGWYNLAIDAARDRMYQLDYRGNLWAFGFADMKWTRLADSIDDRHNCTIVLDPVNDRLWLSRCGPQVSNAFFYFDLARGEWKQQCPGSCNASQADPVQTYDPVNRRLIAFGGWIPSLRLQVRVLPVSPPPPPGTGWQTLKPSANLPAAALPLTCEPCKTTHNRGGWDGSRNRVWYVGADGALWTFDGATWTHHATTGAAPHPATVYGYHEAADVIVGFTNQLPGGGPYRGETWLLPLSTLAWQRGPSHAAGDLVPSSGVGYAGGALVYDPRRRRVIYQRATTGNNDLWALTVSGGRASGSAPAPPSPSSAAMPAPQPSGMSPPVRPSEGARPPAAPAARAPESARVQAPGGQPPPPAAASHPTTPGAAAIGQTAARQVPPATAAESSGSLEIPARTFVARPLAPRDTTPFVVNGGTKHVRLAYNSGDRRIYTAGGDFGSTNHIASENPMGFSVDLGSLARAGSHGDWRLESDYCHPAGNVTPARPDEVVWAYDPGRKGFWMLGGILTAPNDSLCNHPTTGGEGSGSTFKRGLLFFDPAKPRASRWSSVNSRLGTSSLFGVFDPVKDELIFVERGGCGTQIAHLNVRTSQKRAVQFCRHPQPAFKGGNGFLGPLGHYDHWAVDWDARVAYMVFPHVLYRNHQPVERHPKLWRYDLDKGDLSLLPDPPRPRYQVRWDVINPVWDSRNKRLIWMFTPDHCGLIQTVFVYDPEARSWETIAPVQPEGIPVRGALQIYDPGHNVVFLAGSNGCGSEVAPAMPNQSHQFLWRYAP